MDSDEGSALTASAAQAIEDLTDELVYGSRSGQIRGLLSDEGRQEIAEALRARTQRLVRDAEGYAEILRQEREANIELGVWPRTRW